MEWVTLIIICIDTYGRNTMIKVWDFYWKFTAIMYAIFEFNIGEPVDSIKQVEL